MWFHSPRGLPVRRFAWVAGSLIVVVAAAAVVLLTVRESSDELLKRARLSEGDDRISLLTRAIEVSGGEFPQAQLELCIVLARERKIERLEDAFSRLNRDECSAVDLMSLAELSLRAEQWKIASDSLHALSGRPHDVAERLAMQCELYDRSSQTSELLASATELTNLTPDQPAGWWFLARAHEKRQNNMAAISVYRQALTHRLPASDQLQMQYRMFDHCLETGDADSARAVREFLVRNAKSDPRLDVCDARLLHLEGQPAEALQCINRAIQKLGRIPEALRLRGILYLDLDEPAKAIAELREAATAAPEDEVTFFKLAEAYRRLGSRSQDPDHLRAADAYLAEYQRLHARNLSDPDVP